MPLNEYATVSTQVSPQDNSPTAGPIADQDRYSRQVLFPGIGPLGQQRLAVSHVAIVGCGAMGAASASLLARAGVGTLTLIDRDFVEPSNLQRQVLFDEADAHDTLPKAEAARRHIALFNSRVTVHARIADLTPTNIAQLLAPDGQTPVHIILDATDNFETRYLINDFAVQRGTPWIYAAAIGAYAATMNILPSDICHPAAKRRDCFYCSLFPVPCSLPSNRLSRLHLPQAPHRQRRNLRHRRYPRHRRQPRRLHPGHRDPQVPYRPAPPHASHPALLRPLGPRWQR